MKGERSRRFVLLPLVALAAALFVALGTGWPSVVKANFQEEPTPTATPTEVATETPAPPTETPVAATETPAAPTETATSVGGEPGAAIQPPRTGSGGSAGGTDTLWWGVGSAVAGALLFAGGARLALKRR